MSARFGIVEELDPARGKVRVRFPDHDNVVSWWLPVTQGKTLRDRDYWMPDVGEHVVCAMDEHEEAGVVTGAIYSEADPPPEIDPDIRRTVYEDGAVESYNRVLHEYVLDVPVGGSIKLRVGSSELVISDGEITLKTPAFRGVKA